MKTFLRRVFLEAYLQGRTMEASVVAVQHRLLTFGENPGSRP